MRHLFGSLLSKGSGQIHYRIFCTVLHWQLFCKFEIFQNNISISVSSDVGWNFTVFQPSRTQVPRACLGRTELGVAAPRSRIRVCLPSAGSLLRCRDGHSHPSHLVKNGHPDSWVTRQREHSFCRTQASHLTYLMMGFLPEPRKWKHWMPPCPVQTSAGYLRAISPMSIWNMDCAGDPMFFWDLA